MHDVKTPAAFGCLWSSVCLALLASCNKPAPAPAVVTTRVSFNAYDGDGKTAKPSELNFQVNTLSIKQPTVFLKLGEVIPNTPLKLQKFEYKTKPNPAAKEDEEVSELTVIHIVTKATTVLVFQKPADIPIGITPP